MMNINIAVFFVNRLNDIKNKWVLLDSTSQLFTEKQIVPLIGDRITVLSDDWDKMELEEETQYKSILTVKNRITPFSNYDFGILCTYEDWQM